MRSKTPSPPERRYLPSLPIRQVDTLLDQYGGQIRSGQNLILLLTQATCTDISIPAEDIVDRLDYKLSAKIYLGDAFPYIDMAVFGPGVVAAFLGAHLDNSTGRVWFHPQQKLPITEMHFEYDPDNIWFKRIKDIYTTAMNYWQGQVILGMLTLGASLIFFLHSDRGKNYFSISMIILKTSSD